jgi:hypothetical protein
LHAPNGKKTWPNVTLFELDITEVVGGVSADPPNGKTIVINDPFPVISAPVAFRERGSYITE